MKIEIKNMKENHLLNRTEVTFEIEHPNTGTPRRLDVLELLATKMNRDKKVIAIRELRTVFGKNMSKGLAYVYTDEKTVKNEPEYIFKRGQKKEKKEEAAEAPAPAPTPAKPAAKKE